ncbi:hypothetical protein ES705_19953 [subsurface metagenome]
MTCRYYSTNVVKLLLVTWRGGVTVPLSPAGRGGNSPPPVRSLGQVAWGGVGGLVGWCFGGLGWAVSGEKSDSQMRAPARRNLTPRCEYFKVWSKGTNQGWGV